jgi:phage-related protein
MPHSEPLKNGLFELRVRGVQEVRIIYTFHQKNIILLHGFIKKTNKISLKDLKMALHKKKTLE